MYIEAARVIVRVHGRCSASYYIVDFEAEVRYSGALALFEKNGHLHLFDIYREINAG